MCLLKEFLGKTYDQVDSELKTDQRIKRVLCVKTLPGHSVVHRGMKMLPMWYIREFNQKLVKPFKLMNMDVIPDSSGFQLIGRSPWYDIRIGRTNERKDNDKLHILIGYATGIIFDFSITDYRKHDSPRLKGLLSRLYSLGRVPGDSAYLSRDNCRLIAKKGGTPFFHPKSNTIKKPKGVKAWRDMVTFFLKKPIEWLENYHIRSYVEAVFSSIKKCFGRCLRAVKKRMQNKELAMKVVSYNIKQTLYNEMAEKWNLDLWVAP
jgi:hypothetical protein